MSNVKNYFDQADATGDNVFNVTGTLKVNGTQILLTTDIVKSVENTVTLAQVNAGKVIQAGVSGKSYIPVGALLTVSGNFAAGTSIDLVAETTGTIVASYAVAALTTGAVLLENTANVTLGAGFLASLPAGEGLKVVKVGSDFTGGTSVTIRVLYRLA